MTVQEPGERDLIGNQTASVLIDIVIPADAPTELLTAGNGDVMRSRRNEDERLLCLRFPDGESLQTTYENCTERGVTIDVHRIRHEEDG
jgi:hypothetical protein